MNVELAPETNDSRRPRHSRALQIVTIATILLLALGARVFYAYGLPLASHDEVVHLELARDISLSPGSFYLPLGNRATNHPNGVLYLIAVANRLGVGSLFVIRLTLILISLAGLLGVYSLARSFFGHQAATVAIFLASVDRYMVSMSCRLYEPPLSLALVPWALLAMHWCLDRGRPRDWVLLGLLCGVGCNVYYVFLFQPMVFLAYLLLTGKMFSALKQPWAYVALGLLILLMAPNVVWNFANEWSSFRYAGEKPGTLGVCPRFAMLYLGDLLLCLKGVAWISLNAGDKLYFPTLVPSHWAAGLVYLACLLWAACHVRKGRFGLLLTAVLIPGLVGTVLACDEPMDNLRWMQCTMVPVLCLTGWAAAQATGYRIGRIVVGMGMAGFGILLGAFLAGPKCAYFCPEPERALVGEVMAIECISQSDPQRFPPPRAFAEIRLLADQAIARRPGSVVAWCCRADYAETPAERAQALDRAVDLDPDHPMVIWKRANHLIEASSLAPARSLLRTLLGQDPGCLIVRHRLAEVECRLGNYSSAVDYARHLAALRPDDDRPHALLFTIYHAMGDQAKAEASLKAYVTRHRHGNAAAYLTLALEFWERGQPGTAESLLERAVLSKSRRAEDHLLIASLFDRKLNDRIRAIRHLKTAVQLAPDDPIIHCDLASVMEEQEQFQLAIQLYERAIQLAPEFALAHVRLAALLAGRKRFAEAREHFKRAEQLGFEIPPAYQGLAQPTSPRKDPP